ncbi:hypothetical protein DBV39_02030 [Orrella marina]|uniref:Uncharacterized protein n=1 Tax=Orrella marina TaxID=2163011 RepID=A0A2R4XFY9_9BURK|nr:hypothetical protein DBV39_02030 [Orrella marina]
MAFVMDCASQTRDQPGLQIRTPKQDGAEIARQGTTIKLCTLGETSTGRKAKLGWDRIIHGRFCLSFLRSVIGVIPIISMG